MKDVMDKVHSIYARGMRLQKGVAQDAPTTRKNKVGQLWQLSEILWFVYVVGRAKTGIYAYSCAYALIAFIFTFVMD